MNKTSATNDSSQMQDKLAQMEAELAAAQKEAESVQRALAETLRYRITFERLVTEIATRFVSQHHDELHDNMRWALAQLGSFMEVDRASIYLPTGGVLVRAYTWQRLNLPARKDNWHKRPLTNSRWWQTIAKSIQPVHLPDISRIPKAKPGDTSQLPTSDIKSLLIIPLVHQGKLNGLLRFDAIHKPHTWAEADITLLQAFAELVSSAFERREHEARDQLGQELGQLLTGLTEPESLVEMVNEQLRTVLGYDYVQIYLVDAEFFQVENLPSTPTHLVLIHGSGQVGTELRKQALQIPWDAEPSLIALAARTRTSVMVNNVLADGRFLPNPSLPQTRAEASIPLILDNQLLGVLDLQSNEEDAFSSHEKHLLQNIAHQLSIALGNSRQFTRNRLLLQEARTQLIQRQQLTESGRAILSAVDERQLWRSAQRAVASLLGAGKTAVFLYNPHIQHFSCPYAHDLSNKFIVNLNRHFDTLPDRAVITSPEPVIIQDTETDERIERLRHEMQLEGINAYAVFALPAPQGAFGAIAAYRSEKRPFTPDDIATGSTIANIIALALQNVRLFAEISQALTRERSLNQMARTLSSTRDLPTILSSIIRLSAELLEANAGLLGLAIDNQIITFYPYNLPSIINLRPTPKNRSAAWHIINTGESILLPKYADHPRAQPQWVRAGAQAYLGVPIRSGDNILGTLEFFQLNPERLFSERDLRLANAVGMQAGIAIENARLFAEAEQRATALSTALARQEELDQLKDLFIQNVSHELRTPLGLIYGYAELLENSSSANLDEYQLQAIQIIARRTRMLSDLVDDLSALLAAETQEFRRELLSPAQLLYSMLADYQIRAEETGIKLEASIAEKVPLIQGDPTHLRRVFDNLVSNALKFTPRGGKVTMRMWSEKMDVYFEVEDTGAGIAEHHLPRIFERFYQITDGTTPRQKGTGLGLSLVKEIIEAHRGQVSVRSTLNKGTTFTIYMPGVTMSNAD